MRLRFWRRPESGPATPAVRRILVHYHIYKNAGTSIDATLRKHFGPHWAAFDRSAPAAIIRPDELRAFIDEHPTLRSVSSHQCRPPVPTSTGFEIFPLFLLRHPLDRIGSIYRYERKRVSDDAGPEMAKKLEFAEYVAWRLSGPQGGIMRNVQVLYLSGAQSSAAKPWDVQADRALLEEAKRFLASLPAFGIVERFDESLARFQRWLSPLFPGIGFFATRQNVTSDVSAPLEERLRRLRQQLGDTVYELAERSNALDLELFDHACRLFEQAGGRAPAPGGNQAGK